MATLADNLYLKVYKECEALYVQGQWDECLRLGLYNLSDLTTPRYLQIKTLILVAGAVDDWRKSEEYRIEAEERYRVTEEIMAEAEAGSASEDEKRAMSELRKKLDELLEWQADDTPEHITNLFIATNFYGTDNPPKPGNLKDFLYARYKKEHPGAKPAVGTLDELDVVRRYREDDDDIPLEDTEAVRAAEVEEFGGNVNLIEEMKKAVLTESEQDTSMETKHDIEEEKKRAEMESPAKTRSTPKRKQARPIGGGRFVLE